jgi:23S rRNA G2445 N2-methylase RlmL
MKAIAITNKGIEDICALEIKELIKTDSKIKKGFLLFDATEKDIIKLIYSGRTLTKVLLINDLDKYLKNKTFAVKSLSTKLSKQIADKISKGKVDLKNPEVIIYAIDSENYGIDLCGEDLSKRDYRIFLGPESLKGNVAYSLLRIAGFDKKQKLLDCFCKSGIIPIEAALYSLGKSVHFYSKDKFLFLNHWPWSEKYLEELDSKNDKASLHIYSSDTSMNHLNSAKKNAKIAGINKFIKFSRVDLKDIDLKYDKIDCLITIPSGNPEQFFKQAKEVLKKNGKLVLIMKKGAEEIKKASKDFKLKEERVIMQGKEEWKFLVLER